MPKSFKILRFNESKVFSDVAFIRYESTTYSKNLVIGIISPNNIHLSGIYNIYRKWLSEGKFDSSIEIEETCEIIKINQINNFLVDYITTIGEAHFGFKPLVKNTNTKNLIENLMRKK